MTANDDAAQLVRSLDRHKAEIGRLRALVCECGHGSEPGDLHDDECPASVPARDNQ